MEDIMTFMLHRENIYCAESSVPCKINEVNKSSACAKFSCSCDRNRGSWDQLFSDTVHTNLPQELASANFFSENVSLFQYSVSEIALEYFSSPVPVLRTIMRSDTLPLGGRR